MSIWEDSGIGNAIQTILRNQPISQNHPDAGRAFMTPYQIAIEIELNHPDVFSAIREPVGGKGTGQHHSLAQYIARELARRLDEMQLELAFISGIHESELSYSQREVVSSLTDSQYNLSIFRYIG